MSVKNVKPNVKCGPPEGFRTGYVGGILRLIDARSNTHLVLESEASKLCVAE